jgi:putative RecB family exonuclease
MKYKYAPYSYSKIATYEQCPRKFKYQYIDKIPVERKPQIHFDRGKLFHLLLEFNGDLNKIKETKDWKEIKEHGLLSKEQIQEVFKIYKTFISEKPGKDIVNKKVFMKEFPLGLNQDLELVPYNSDEVLLRGYIDAAYLIDDRDDICIVVDWKSGKYKEPEKQSYAQLLWYSLGLFSKNPYLEKIMLVFAYVEHNKINTKIVQRKDIDKYKKALFDKIQKIEIDTEFEKEETALCDWCDFREVCLEDN